MRLKDKVAIITGGASGIGKITAKRFLEEGAKVVIFDIDQSVMDKALEELKQVSENVWSKKVNVADNHEVSENVDKVINDLGEVDIMIANAGITRDSMAHKMDQEKFDCVIDVNLRGSYNSARSVIEHMRAKGHGKILFTSSVVGEYGNIGQANYAASKAGVIGMAKSMAKELARKNVQVNVVAPGYTNTDMMQTVPEKVLDMIRAKTPAGRLAKPEEIANAFVFLASEESNYITGHVLSVNGGLTL